MFDDPQSRVEHALGRLAAARQALAAVDLAALSRDELLDLMAAVEIDSRQRAAVGYALVAMPQRSPPRPLGIDKTARPLYSETRSIPKLPESSDATSADPLPVPQGASHRARSRRHRPGR